VGSTLATVGFSSSEPGLTLSFLRWARLASDDVTITYEGRGATVSAAVVEIPADTPA
jgi:hypothetical protein